MSLFPAYSEENPSTSEKSEEKDSWLTNSSFIPFEPIAVPLSSEEELPSTSHEPPPSKKHTKKEKKKKKKRSRSPSSELDDSNFSKLNYLKDPNVNFYEEKSGAKSFMRVETLRKPACPMYNISAFRLHNKNLYQKKKSKRYYLSTSLMKKISKDESFKAFESLEPEMEEESLQKYLRSNPKDVLEWLKYLKFKDLGNPSYQKEKAKLEIAEKGMKLNPESEELLREYLKILPKVHPTDEALEIIEGLLNKDQNNYQLWNALIYNKQSSMAQCIVPDVLKLYEKCMTTLFSVIKSDEILVKIFKNCAVFMRQSGLWEQFFTLIHLALTLNVSNTAFSNTNRFYSQENHATLIEYEELILKSGLPMNEIWLRIEKLRSAFNFLPCLTSGTSDPQRMVMNEDVCHYIFPLINQNYKFDFFIMILKMLKYPFEGNLFHISPFFALETHDYDNIEDILPALLTTKKDTILDAILYEIIKETNFPPSFVNVNLAYEEYVEVIFEILLSGSKVFTTKQNLIVFRLYLRLERILCVMEKLKSEGISKDYKKKVKNRIKKAIKSSNYEENLLVYNDFALIIYEMEGFEAAEGILLTTMRQNFIENTSFMSLVLSYVEILLAEQKNLKAIEVLTESVLEKMNFEDTEILNSKKLVALQKQKELLDLLVETEAKSDIFEIEDYFTPSRFLLTLKSRTLYLFLVKNSEESVKQLKEILLKFPEQNQKHKFIREKCYEFASMLSHLGTNVFEFLREGLDEFPYNIHLLKVITLQLSTPWLQIRSLFNKNLTTNSVIFLIAACKYRKYHIQEAEESYKMRIINILKDATSQKSKVRQNSLIWRFYLRALFDVNSNATLSRCKNTLFEALDVCPWSKALYLDGAFFAPQELSQLLDLIVEKQLRIHALPEELSILRDE